MNNKILVVGYFGYETNQLDGQTIKTRNIYELLQKHCNELSYYDTQVFRKNPLSLFILLYNACRCNKLILLPAQNNLTAIFPILSVLSGFFNFDIIHIAVGGWLDKYCEKHKWIARRLRKNKVILVENRDVIASLQENLRFNNVEYFHNYRLTDFKPSISTESQEHKPFRIVFMARINRMKGLDVVFDIARHYETNNHDVIIDFYGPINEEDREYFEMEIAKYNCVNYKGILDPADIYATLEYYDLLILPTKYPGEGFPGSILDAYISGIPVLISNWKYLPEFVSNGSNGYICEVDNVQQFIEVIDKLMSDNHILTELKRNAYESSKLYSPEAAWNILKEYLN